MTVSLRHALYQGQHALGFSVGFPAPGIIECIGAGWDWAWIDGQHGQHDYRSLLECVRAADALGLAPVVRASGHEYSLVGTVLDMGVVGVMIPMVDTAEQAREVVRAVRFPPLGARSYGGRRVVDLRGRDYCHTANEEVLLVVQIETREALAQAEAIAAVEGVDALFFGPDDVKLRLGIPINTGLLESDQLLRSLEAVAGAARNAGKISGTIAANAAVLGRVRGMGCLLNVGGSDVGFLRTGAQQKLSELRAMTK
jgi:4-hydroxy-2-oxoheptanedioate aldolase